MAITLRWRCSKPADGLKDAMERLALEVAEEGEYTTVQILSTPKTTTGGRLAKPHFKVRLIGEVQGRPVTHEHCLMIEHRTARGSSRYRMNNRERERNYPYETLVPANGPPTNCPKKRRLQREAETAASYADGWYPDPWTADSGMAERYYESGQWTPHTR